ncbi:MAG: hypothetical protein HOP08_01030 [Cyclobacteriaceae bacterium]|nr:hypothetical protein [Cyclobacteriaceae bacterium]
MTKFIPLERDPKWSAFNEHTWESFQESYLPKCDLIPSVNEEVRKQYRAIRKLMAYSYFEYEFFDIAAAQMSMLMEMAMAWKYETVTGEPWKKKIKKGEPRRDLKNLFEWLGSNGYFDKTYFVSADLLRGTRNYYAHPKKHGFAGGINLTRINELIFLINELYDPNLNKRNVLAIELNTWLTKNCKMRMTLCTPAETIPLADLAIAYIDCSTGDPRYYLGCFPLLKLQEIDQDSHYAPRTLMFIQLVDLKMNDGYLAGTEIFGGQEVRIEVANEANTLLIDQWYNQLETMVHVAAQMPAWRFMELFKLVGELKTKYFINMSEGFKVNEIEELS